MLICKSFSALCIFTTFLYVKGKLKEICGKVKNDQKKWVTLWNLYYYTNDFIFQQVALEEGGRDPDLRILQLQEQNQSQSQRPPFNL